MELTLFRLPEHKPSVFYQYGAGAWDFELNMRRDSIIPGLVKRFSNYRMLEKLVRRRYGAVVYKAEDNALHRLVRVEHSCTNDVAGKPEALERFHVEGRALPCPLSPKHRHQSNDIGEILSSREDGKISLPWRIWNGGKR